MRKGRNVKQLSVGVLRIFSNGLIDLARNGLVDLARRHGENNEHVGNSVEHIEQVGNSVEPIEHVGNSVIEDGKARTAPHRGEHDVHADRRMVRGGRRGPRDRTLSRWPPGRR